VPAPLQIEPLARWKNGPGLPSLPPCAPPELWNSYAAGTCAHPSRDDYAGHEGAIVAGAQATFTAREGDAGGPVAAALCQGKRYSVQVRGCGGAAAVGGRGGTAHSLGRSALDSPNRARTPAGRADLHPLWPRARAQLDLPRQAGQDPHAHITASAGRFDAVPGDIVARCSEGGARRAATFATAQYTTVLNMCEWRPRPGRGAHLSHALLRAADRTRTTPLLRG
jgi:hypothetical protein